MKKTPLSIASLLAVSIGCALATLPTYKTFTAGGNSTTGATVIMPADPNSQIRVVTVTYSSDKTPSTLAFNSGVTAYVGVITNATSGVATTSSVTNNINSTNGLVAASVMVLQHAGTCYSATLSSYGGTAGAYFLVLNSGGWGVAQTPGDDIYQMGTATTPFYVNATTNSLSGEALFVGNYGRPVSVALSVATTTNQISSASAHYDSQSN